MSTLAVRIVVVTIAVLTAVLLAATLVLSSRLSASTDPGSIFMSAAVVPILSAGFAAAGAVLAWKRPRNAVGWIFLAVGLVAALEAASLPGIVVAIALDWPMWLQVVVASFAYAGWTLWFVLAPLALLYFPSGRLTGWAARSIAVVTVTVGLGITVLVVTDGGASAFLQSLGVPEASAVLNLPTTAWLASAAPAGRVGLLGALFAAQAITVLATIVLLVVRFVRGTELVRRQLFWILLAALATFMLFLVQALFATFGVGVVLALLTLPAAMLAAIIQVNLFDVKLVFSRALAWLILSVVLGATFIAVVAVLGTILVETASAVIAALAVALAFEPLRRVLQRYIDRLVFGRRSEAVYLVGLVGADISNSSDLQAVVDRLANSLKLPWVALRSDGTIVAASGQESGTAEVFALRHGDAEVGTLEVGPRRGERVLSRSDRSTLELLTPMLSALLSLTSLSKELVASRGQIVEATEEERRRVQRDLHDGVASALGGIAFTIEGIRNGVVDDPQKAVRLLEGVHADVVRANSSLREVIHDLRPPELDTLGLVGALRQMTNSLRQPSVDNPTVTFSAPDDMRLPAAIELAVYRIGVEATTNALRHSDATDVDIDLRVSGPTVSLSVSDNAHAAGRAWQDGVGLRSMRHRAELLGGRFSAGPTATGGRVDVTIPLREEQHA